MSLSSRRTAVRLGVCVAAAALVIGPVSTVSATPSPAPTNSQASPVQKVHIRGTGTATPLSEARQRDLKAFARQHGRNLEHVVAEQTGAEQYGEAANAIAVTTDTFVKAGLGRAGDAFDFWIQFTTVPSQDVVNRLRKLPGVTEVRYGGEISAKALELAAPAIIDTLRENDHLLVPGTASVGFDTDATGLVVEYATRGGADRGAVGRALTSAATRAGATLGGKSPRVSFVEVPNTGARVSEVRIMGGQALWSGDNRVCTTGFTAKRTSTGSPGVVTAQHCLNSVRYWGLSGAISFLANAAGQGDAEIDLQFHLTNGGHSTYALFNAGDGDTEREVRSTGMALEGTVYCHHGISTDKGCSEVTHNSMCLEFEAGGDLPAGTRCGIAQTANDVSAGGDSGGPWYSGHQAVGIHTGASPGHRSYFTMIHKVEEKLFARVKVVP